MAPNIAPDSSAKPRRSHRKSRNGCVQCKKRHIRCDESRPACSHCAKGERTCSFLLMKPFPSPGSSTSESDRLEGQYSPPRSDKEVHRDDTSYSVIHMTLLHHASCNMRTAMGFEGQMGPGITVAIESASTATYLLDQLLALSALHLATVDPSKAALYHYHATDLQTRALGVFKQVKDDISESNCVPMFLFGALLGIHVLRETLANIQGSNLPTFIQSFCRYATLHCGVRAVINGFWPKINQSSLKPLLHITDLAEQLGNQAPGPETREFAKFLESSAQDCPSIAACWEALKSIQWVLDLSRLEGAIADTGAHGSMSWPLMVPPEYFDILAQHKPEALVVFAFYAAILHRYRRFWVFADAGVVLLRMIMNELGDDWREHLKWPIQVLNEDQNSREFC